MVHCPSPTVSPGQLYSLLSEVRHIGLSPGVLMSPNHHTRSVAIEVENLTAGEVMMLIEPILQSKVSVDIMRGWSEHKSRWWSCYGWAGKWSTRTFQWIQALDHSEREKQLKTSLTMLLQILFWHKQNSQEMSPLHIENNEMREAK